jgi:hypothetical protein
MGNAAGLSLKSPRFLSSKWGPPHTLAELEAQLPPGLECVVRQPADPPEVVEVWFPA